MLKIANALLSLLLILCIFMAGISPALAITIEWLEFQVPPGEQAEFIKQDRLIWDKFLRQYPGFLGKEIWVDRQNKSRLIVLVRWHSYQEWKAIPLSKVQAVTEQFHQALGKAYPIISAHAFQVN
ncbi:MAG: TIGR03792 family protein [Pseudanabaenaceae cyanobacterium SKYGB_i_bin29]|nr:TIGR03792 family protein [Pseudanabaenaceae cyanobacterium SKYG29]MDW8422133.1 TIGR03792 family protein [Pseudanabaenaceae cyanobacterium SKYGB_i_bin29]